MPSASARTSASTCTANFAAEYRDNVFEHFLAEYAAGRTPNPDILCNREIKFKQFVDYATTLGADLIATGHYARRWLNGLEPAAALRADPAAADFRLLKGADPAKDQSYFLQAVPRAQLARCLFPLGDLHKSRGAGDRTEAEGLHNHRRKDSTGICFIGERRFRDFLQRYLPVQAGPIVDTGGAGSASTRGSPTTPSASARASASAGCAARPKHPGTWPPSDLATSCWWRRAERSTPRCSPLLACSVRSTGSVPGLSALPLRLQAKIRYRQADQRCTLYAAVEGALRVVFESASAGR
jgi:tRNA-uridine 2-sulfurtransferase